MEHLQKQGIGLEDLRGPYILLFSGYFGYWILDIFTEILRKLLGSALQHGHQKSILQQTDLVLYCYGITE